MATQKEKVDALTAELAEEKKATKRARTERDKYKAQVASKGDKVTSFKGHVLLTDAQQIEKGWRSETATRLGKHALHYADGTIEVYDSQSLAQDAQRFNAYSKKKPVSTMHSTGAASYVCNFAEGCSDHGFGTVIAGDFSVYVDKDKDGKVKSVTLVAD